MFVGIKVLVNVTGIGRTFSFNKLFTMVREVIWIINLFL